MYNFTYHNYCDHMLHIIIRACGSLHCLGSVGNVSTFRALAIFVEAMSAWSQSKRWIQAAMQHCSLAGRRLTAPERSWNTTSSCRWTVATVPAVVERWDFRPLAVTWNLIFAVSTFPFLSISCIILHKKYSKSTSFHIFSWEKFLGLGLKTFR